MRIRPLPILAAIFLAGCQSERIDEKLELETVEYAIAQMSDKAGQTLGTVTLKSESGLVVLAVELRGVAPGDKAFHLHTTGLCEAPGFTSAGGHLNPAGNTHGSLSIGGKHLGDLPNLEIGESGTVLTRIGIDRSRDEILKAMRDSDGTAVVMHAGPDDYVSDPAGAAGPRIACGVFEFST
ncbi:MAG: superoxide dismutase family protein [Erythrobacter sp.]